MRISDWSSDVCSSDLKAGARLVQQHAETVDDNTAAGPRLRQQVGLQRAVDEVGDHRIARQRSERDVKRRLPGHAEAGRVHQESGAGEGVGALLPGNDRDRTSNLGSELLGPLPVSIGKAQRRPARSEEHTSELPSLMRIPYAV